MAGAHGVLPANFAACSIDAIEDAVDAGDVKRAVAEDEGGIVNIAAGFVLPEDFAGVGVGGEDISMLGDGGIDDAVVITGAGIAEIILVHLPENFSIGNIDRVQNAV